MLRLTDLLGFLAGARMAFAKGWKFWGAGQASNGRAYWDLSPSGSSGAGLPSSSCSAGSPNYAFLIEFSEAVPWNTITIRFSSFSGTTTYQQCLVSDVTTGAWSSQDTSGTISGNALTFTRSGNFGTYTTVGTGVSGAPPAACQFFGFGCGLGGASATFTVESIEIS